MANAAIYLPVENVDLSKFLDVVDTDKTFWKQASFFSVEIGSDTVRFNLMPDSQLAEHLRGFLGYIDTLEETSDMKNVARSSVKSVKSVLGLVTDREFRDNEDIYSTLFKIAEYYNGFVFVFNSLFLPGRMVVGPARGYYSTEDT